MKPDSDNASAYDPNLVANNHIPKSFVIGFIVFLILIIGASIYMILTDDPGQSLEDQEPVVEFVSGDSRLAGVQFLLDYGLTGEQYDSVCSKIDKALDKADTESKYFEYVFESLVMEKAPEVQDNTLSDEERTAILAAISGNDHTTEKHGPEGIAASTGDHSEKEALPIFSFKLKSNSTGKEYAVKFDSRLSSKDMTVKVTDPDGKEI